MSFSLSLVPEEAEALQDEGVIGVEILGKRKVSAALLSLPSPPESGHSSTSSTSVHVQAITFAATASIDLPTNTESVAALTHIGFTRKVAGEIFERWARRPDPDQNPDDILSYAFGQISRLRSQPWLTEMPPRECMNALGISEELQTTLLDVAYTQIFESQTIEYWLKDTMSIRYKTLEQLLERLKSHATQTIMIRKGGKKRAKVEGLFNPAASSSSQQPAVSTDTRINIQTSAEDHGLPDAWVAVESEPRLPDGFIALYKGKATAEFAGGERFVRDGSINMTSIRSDSGGDFNHLNYAWYWTEDKETAERYRVWAAARSTWSETWLIRVLIPKVYVNSLRKEQLFYSRDWKEYIWYCKRQVTPPSKFDKLWKHGQADVVEGHICGTAMQIIQRAKKENVQEKISESHCLVSNGKKPTQWVLMNAEAAERFGDIAKDNIHIELHSPAVKA